MLINNNHDIFQEKAYLITNYRLSDSFIPVPRNLNGEVTCKYMGKIPKKKIMVQLFTWRAYFIIKS